MGYKIRRPASHDRRTSTFRHGLATTTTCLTSCGGFQRVDSKLYRLIMRATAVFLESYYNTPSVDVRARVLLQAASFEILFDLPDQAQRKAFKDAIEAWTGNSGDRHFRYKYEVPKSRKNPQRPRY